MAKKTYTVKKGDTLSGIAAKYKSEYGTTVDSLAKLNNIEDKDLIYIGQVLTISKTGTPSSTPDTKPESTPTNTTSTVTIVHFGLRSDSERTVFATWEWSKEHTEHYQVIWQYYIDNIWFTGSDSTTKDKQSVYDAPQNAVSARVKIKPISTKHTVNKKETEYWTASWSTYKTYSFSANPPSIPATPSVDLKDFTLTASLDNLDVNGTHIEFQVVKDDSKVFATGKAKIVTNSASYSCKVTAGSKYKVRARSSRDNLYSDWSDYSANVNTKPSASSGITTCKTNSANSIYLEWASVANASSYDIEYAIKKEYFDNSDQAITKNTEFTHYEVTNLEPGKEYFFRVRAVNEQGKSAWSAIKSVILGKKPSAPTTWSSTTTAIVGDEVTLYWMHNSEDGSTQRYAEVEITHGSSVSLTPIDSTKQEDDKKTMHLELNTSTYTDETSIEWRVRTKGIVDEWSDWSIKRTIKIYVQPTLSISAASKSINLMDLTQIKAHTNASDSLDGAQITPEMASIEHKGQNTFGRVPVYGLKKGVTYTLWVEYYVHDRSDDSSLVTTIRYGFGTDKAVLKVNPVDITQNEFTYHDTMSYTPDGDLDKVWIMLYSNYRSVEPAKAKIRAMLLVGSYDVNTVPDFVPYGESSLSVLTSYPLSITGVAGPDNQTPISYHLSVVSNDSYETVDNVGNVKMVSVGEEIYSKHFDTSTQLDVTLSAGDINLENNASYTITGIVSMDSGLTATATHDFTVAWTDTQYDPMAEVFIDKDTLSAYIRPFCVNEYGGMIGGTTLSVYRREFDGRFTEIATGLANTDSTFITDPHPALDYARYRIVATNESNGSVSYYDLPGYPVGETGIVLQWDEKWSDLVTENEDEIVEPVWAGSTLKLPYNVDISDDYSQDVSLVNYIGREYPVSYYGTQLGSTSSWTAMIPMYDKETLYGLRRLARWTGDVYVREPSGSGYWANINVSFSQKHLDVVIPVTLRVTRVEGGI